MKNIGYITLISLILAPYTILGMKRNNFQKLVANMVGTTPTKRPSTTENTPNKKVNISAPSIPDDLKTGKIKVEQIKSLEQPDSTSCGCYVLLNAMVIDQILSEQVNKQNSTIAPETITATVIQSRTKNLIELIQLQGEKPGTLSKKTLDETELREKMKIFSKEFNLSVNTLHFFGIQTETSKEKPVLFDAELYSYGDETNVQEISSAEEIISNISTDILLFLSASDTDIDTVDSVTTKKKLTRAIHFCFNTGGHWILISLVREPGEKPRIIYMNSASNHGLEETSVSTHFIRELKKHCESFLE